MIQLPGFGRPIARHCYNWVAWRIVSPCHHSAEARKSCCAKCSECVRAAGMFKKILIANRGEIALRVIRACRELGVESVIAYSEADRDSLPVRMADDSICIGPGPSGKSYLNIPNIISAAVLKGVEAIHPGYGFLSENASFAEVCADCGLVFIGPPAAAMTKMGDKAEARSAMSRAGLPLLPGTDVLRSLGEGEAAAARIGFPLMLKAAAGGGGRGIRLVHRP